MKEYLLEKIKKPSDLYRAAAYFIGGSCVVFVSNSLCDMIVNRDNRGIVLKSDQTSF